MDYKYYIQVGARSARNIFDEYGIYVAEVDGMTSIPQSKSKFDDFTDLDQGENPELPDTLYFKEKIVTITFKALNKSGLDVRNNVNNFLEEIFLSGEISYFDTYRNNGFRGCFDKNSLTEEIYRNSNNFIKFNLSFMVPNGISYGYSNEGGTSINLTVNEGVADLYFSDGFIVPKVSGNVNKSLVGGFVIITPSVHNSVTIN